MSKSQSKNSKSKFKDLEVESDEEFKSIVSGEQDTSQEIDAEVAASVPCGEWVNGEETKWRVTGRRLKTVDVVYEPEDNDMLDVHTHGAPLHPDDSVLERLCPLSEALSDQANSGGSKAPTSSSKNSKEDESGTKKSKTSGGQTSKQDATGTGTKTSKQDASGTGTKTSKQDASGTGTKTSKQEASGTGTKTSKQEASGSGTKGSKEEASDSKGTKQDASKASGSNAKESSGKDSKESGKDSKTSGTPMKFYFNSDNVDFPTRRLTGYESFPNQFGAPKEKATSAPVKLYFNSDKIEFPTRRLTGYPVVNGIDPINLATSTHGPFLRKPFQATTLEIEKGKDVRRPDARYGGSHSKPSPTMFHVNEFGPVYKPTYSHERHDPVLTEEEISDGIDITPSSFSSRVSPYTYTPRPRESPLKDVARLKTSADEKRPARFFTSKRNFVDLQNSQVFEKKLLPEPKESERTETTFVHDTTKLQNTYKDDEPLQFFQFDDEGNYLQTAVRGIGQRGTILVAMMLMLIGGALHHVVLAAVNNFDDQVHHIEEFIVHNLGWVALGIGGSVVLAAFLKEPLKQAVEWISSKFEKEEPPHYRGGRKQYQLMLDVSSRIR